MYQSNSHDNQGGCWLVRKAEFNVGSHINSMFRLKCRVNDPNSDKRSALADKRHVTYCSKYIYYIYCTCIYMYICFKVKIAMQFILFNLT